MSPYVERLNIIGNYDRIVEIGQAMNIDEHFSTGLYPDKAMAVIGGIKSFADFVGIPANLKVLGVKPEDFEIMAENAMKDACAVTNPRKARKRRSSKSIVRPTRATCKTHVRLQNTADFTRNQRRFGLWERIQIGSLAFRSMAQAQLGTNPHESILSI